VNKLEIDWHGLLYTCIIYIRKSIKENKKQKTKTNTKTKNKKQKQTQKQKQTKNKETKNCLTLNKWSGIYVLSLGWSHIKYQILY